MSIVVKLLIGLVLGLAGAALSSVVPGAGTPPGLYLLFAAVGIGGILVGTLVAPLPGPAASGRESGAAAQASDGERETGTVKWFNGTKGFGFIIRENGDEIFVHYRSIIGEGRRSLQDGQTVTFVVADTAKGPQAEQVEPG